MVKRVERGRTKRCAVGDSDEGQVVVVGVTVVVTLVVTVVMLRQQQKRRCR